jgi:acyl-CoA synthetase (AMP-forming)/AMP-acid ligase II
MALHELLDETLGAAGQRAHWRFPDEEVDLTLGEIVSAGFRYAAAFGELGVRRGDRVGVVLDNVFDYPSILLGLWNVGAVAVPLRPRGGLHLDLGEFLRRVDDVCGLRLAVAGDEPDDAPPGAFAGEPGKVVRRTRLRAMASAAATSRSSSSRRGARPPRRASS